MRKQGCIKMRQHAESARIKVEIINKKVAERRRCDAEMLLRAPCWHLSCSARRRSATLVVALRFCRPSAAGLALIPPAALDGGTTGSLVSVQLLLFLRMSQHQRAFAFCFTTEISDCDTKLRLRGNEKSAFLTVSANWSWHSPAFRGVIKWIIASYIKNVIFEKLRVTCAYAVAWPRTLRGSECHC